MNCGQFICGQDSHTLDGQPCMDGIPISGGRGLGCRSAFHLNSAGYYNVDRERLRLLRDQIHLERCNLERCEEISLVWEKARSMEVPCVVKIVRNVHGENLMLPYTELFGQNTELFGQNREPKGGLLIQVLWESSRLSPYLSLLPDLIEVSSSSALRKNIFLHDSNSHIFLGFVSVLLLASRNLLLCCFQRFCRDNANPYGNEEPTSV